MRRLLLSLLLLTAALPARADDMTGPRAAVRDALIDARDKILDLAKAMPEEKYAWRPGEGVRSAGEVYRHVAQANYLLPGFLGIKAPEGIVLKDMDTTPLDKAKTIALVEQSFVWALDAIAKTPDSALSDSTKFFGQPTTKMNVMMAMATHAHEHLGQSIAYARSNKVTPPWTARAEAAQAAKKAKS